MAVKREDPDGMKQVPIIKLENQDPSREENPFYADPSDRYQEEELHASREQLVRALRTRQEREERQQFDGQGDQTM